MTRARPLVYDRARRGGSVAEFATTGYWRRVRERPGLLLISALLLFGPWVLAAVWAVRDPGAASGVVPSEYQSVTGPTRARHRPGTEHRGGGRLLERVFTNNIRVTIARVRRRDRRRARDRGAARLPGRAARRDHGPVDRGRQRAIVLRARHRPRRARAVVHRRRRRGGAAHGVGARRAPVAAAAESRSPPRRASRSRSCWEPRRGWSLAGLVEGFVTPRGLGLGPVIVVGALSARVLGARLWRRAGAYDAYLGVMRRSVRIMCLQPRPRLRPEVRADARVREQVGRGLDHVCAPLRRSWAATRRRASSTSSATAAA